LVTTNW